MKFLLLGYLIFEKKENEEYYYIRKYNYLLFFRCWLKYEENYYLCLLFGYFCWYIWIDFDFGNLNWIYLWLFWNIFLLLGNSDLYFDLYFLFRKYFHFHWNIVHFLILLVLVDLFHILLRRFLHLVQRFHHSRYFLQFLHFHFRRFLCLLLIFCIRLFFRLLFRYFRNVFLFWLFD